MQNKSSPTIISTENLLLKTEVWGTAFAGNNTLTFYVPASSTVLAKAN